MKLVFLLFMVSFTMPLSAKRRDCKSAKYQPTGYVLDAFIEQAGNGTFTVDVCPACGECYQKGKKYDLGKK